ncbi:LacI family DNA-binding transcriptional regulator [Microbulbifer rhizosphaerae]|uniref:LacI family repressor for deo operon, udp, cdd, tsx, nupC, and nupG n=1 Tax=Microbulbifer rhizosphaerae TaxID=1562603 RepID=A0A7W4WEF1_9GAMM|nr:LacI family DNA-binding transcriptional regulator [Microbulbifer rhizosphaerae]MBB3062031.1 LacI family repressor for deo operon, udp, cdd, tsx, nupC, and nupG [Microbulbifer rhizosphaerae]
MSNIREVSRVAGVSIATVSRALSHPEKVSKEALAKVNAAIEKVKYRPNMMARNFRAVRAYSIVVLVPNISNLFFATVIRGIEDAAQQKGYSVLLGDTRDSIARERDYTKLVETRQADGILQLRPHVPGESLEPEADIPMVSTCGCEDTPYPSVRIDNAGAAGEIVQYLIGQGHRRIGVLAGLRDNPHSRDRLRGYREALHKADIPYDPDLLVNGDFTMGSGLMAASHFARMKNRPTAIFSMNDEMAIGCIQGLKSAGIRVPEDMSITGFDDIEFARYSDPPLTTVAQPAEELGRIGFNTLLELIEGQELQQTETVLPYEFIVRKSTPALS